MTTPLPPVDPEGFLCDTNDWTKPIAQQLALNEGITLTDAHWEVLDSLRAFYQEFDLAPAMRPLIRYLKLHLNKHDINSLYLLSLFPGSPAKLAAKIAGLPKPENCL